jgi:hypothetical protein
MRKHDLLAELAHAHVTTAASVLRVRPKQRRSRTCIATEVNDAHWINDPGFVTEIEKTKRLLARVVPTKVSCEDFDAELVFGTGFKVKKLPVFAESALILEIPGHVHYETDSLNAGPESAFAITVSIAPRSVTALWRSGTGLRERGKYTGSVAITTCAGTVKRSINFIHQTGQLSNVLSRSQAVVDLLSGAFTDAYYESISELPDND